MTRKTLACGKDGRKVEITHARARGFACGAHSIASFFTEHGLAVEVDHLTGTSGNEYAMREGARKADDVAHAVGPESAAGGDVHGVADVRLDVGHGQARRIVGTQAVHRHELEEHPVVEVQKHRGVV